MEIGKITSSNLGGELDNEGSDTLGLSKTELAQILVMCDMLEGEEHHLPAWFTKVAEKFQTENAKN